MTTDLLIPSMMLMLFGWLVPRGLSLVFPEGVGPLLRLAATSVVLMFAIAMLFFMGLYQARGAPLREFFTEGLLDGMIFFGKLGAASALIWGPILILSVAGLPKHWVEEEW